MSSVPQSLGNWKRQPKLDQQARYRELLQAYSQLRDEMRNRTMALASAAHDLKTPLSVLSGYLEILLNEKLGPVTDRQGKVLKAMQASGARLHQFIQDFLTYTALETSNMQLNVKIGDLNECLKELVDIWLPRFQDAGIALYFLPNDSFPAFPFDYHKLQHVISNLLDNAHSCTPSGGTVWINTEQYLWDRRLHRNGGGDVNRRTKPAAGAQAVRINVCDTGPGIPPEFHQEIFEDFVSLRSSRNGHGTGLGLAIARRLMQAQHGKIWVESEVGSGSRFSLLLPLKPL
jgi:signal transduction histidine kinase